MMEGDFFRIVGVVCSHYFVWQAYAKKASDVMKVLSCIHNDKITPIDLEKR